MFINSSRQHYSPSNPEENLPTKKSDSSSSDRPIGDVKASKLSSRISQKSLSQCGESGEVRKIRAHKKGSSSVDRLSAYQVSLGEPRVPTIDNRLNQRQVEQWIAAYPEGLRPLMARLAGVIKHVDHPTFMAHFMGLVERFNQMMSEKPNSDYSILVEPGKSNLWMAEWAVGKLATPPVDVLPLGDKGALYQQYIKQQSQIADRAPASNIVLFDDGIYSGKQMSNFIEAIMKAHKDVLMRAEESAGSTSQAVTMPDIYVISPYMTESGRAKLMRKAESWEMGSHLHLLFSERISTIDEFFTPEECDHLVKSLWSVEMVGADPRQFATEFKQGPYSRGNIWFQHKVPNFLSFVQAIEDGVVYSADGRILNGSYRVNSENEPVFEPNAGEEFELIPKTTPPYHNKSEEASSHEASLSEASLSEASLSEASLSEAILHRLAPSKKARQHHR